MKCKGAIWSARLVALAAPLLLGACATNALRIDYAEDLAARGHEASAASSAFLGKVEDARVAANVELATSDPQCLPNTAFLRLSPDLSQVGTDSARGWLCAPSAEPGTVELSMAPLGRELEPTVTLIAALGDYSDAVAAILDDDGNAPAEDFTATLGLLTAAAGTANALGVAPAGGLPTGDDPRIAAITGFIGFVADLAKEQRKVDQLRKLTGSTGSAELVAALENHLGAWEVGRRSDIALQATVASSVMAHAFRADPPPDAATRREMITGYYARQRGAREEVRAYQVLDNLLGALGKADSDLRRVLAENPQLTREERAAVARTFRDRVTRALETATTLLTAF